MTAVKDLPPELRFALVEGAAFDPEDDVSHISLSNPAVGDMPHDGKVSFRVQGDVFSATVVVGDDDRVEIFREWQGASAIFAPNVSQWARRLDPKAGDPALPQKSCAIASECRMDKEAHRAIVAATGKDSSAVFKGNGVSDRPLEISALAELADLPLGHPAREYGQQLLSRFADAVMAVPPSKATNEVAIRNVYDPYRRKIHDMKSAKVFYDAAVKAWEEFPHMRAKEVARILYPAAGSNVAALSSAMALIDQGAPGVEATFTEIDREDPARALKAIEAWAAVNPAIEILSNDFEPIASMEGGTRLKLRILYKGSPVTLTYAIDDSPKGLYFHPADLARADMVIIHDAYSLRGESDELLLAQVFPLLKPGDAQKAILLPDSFEANPPIASEYFGRHAIRGMLPVKGWTVPGSYGHGESYPVYQKKIGLPHLYMTEVGPSLVQGGWLFSTGQPLVVAVSGQESETSSNGVASFVSLGLLSGGEDDPGYCLSDDSARLDCFPWISSGKSTPEHGGLKGMLSWLDRTSDGLRGADRDILLLAVIRMFLMNRSGFDERFHKECPPNLAEKIRWTMTVFRLIPLDEKRPLRKIIEANSAVRSQKANPMIEKIDQALRALRRA